MTDLQRQLEEATARICGYWIERQLDLAKNEGVFWSRFKAAHRHDPTWRYRHKSRRGQEQDFMLAAPGIVRRYRRGHDISEWTFDRAMQAVLKAAYDDGYEAGADANY